MSEMVGDPEFRVSSVVTKRKLVIRILPRRQLKKVELGKFIFSTELIFSLVFCTIRYYEAFKCQTMSFGGLILLELL